MAQSQLTADSPRLAAVFLEGALLLVIIVHVLAMASMILLLPGMPGGAQAQVEQRAIFVAGHPGVWRFGWLFWQLAALSDLLLAIALLCTPWIPRLPALLAVIFTLAGMIPDQTGQYLWTWHGPALARSALASGNAAIYASFEMQVFRRIAVWGTFGYLLGALMWTWCFAAAGTWARWLTRLSWVLWPGLAIVTALLLLPAGTHMPLALIVSLGNALAFALMTVWLIAVSERVLRRSRPDESYGRWARFRHPWRGLTATAANWLANSRFAAAVGEWLPMFAMDSDITDVVYVNYLVEAQRVASLVPPPLQLQRLGPGGRYTMFTFLTFRHGHFGPRILGPLRKLWPSPVQSNWRLYVEDPRTRRRGIQFLTIAITLPPTRSPPAFWPPTSRCMSPAAPISSGIRTEPSPSTSIPATAPRRMCKRALRPPR